ncbi:MAG: FHA domain-containing protein [Candidatus Cloacimonetes bacterium]|nr:FHA domain-containing protein [Candidatus Cloacimonadota bacterium]
MSKECQHCYNENEIQAVSCINCGAIFNDIITKTLPNLELTDKFSGKSLKILGERIQKEEKSSMILGREGDIEPDFFREYRLISRKQCKIIFDDDHYKIEHIPTATNPTKIEYKTIGAGIKQIIRDGDILTLADKEFKISISIEETSVDHDVAAISDCQQEPASSDKTLFIITCDVCGRKYSVSSINDKIAECEDCDDYDKYKISRISAKEIKKNAN